MTGFFSKTREYLAEDNASVWKTFKLGDMSGKIGKDLKEIQKEWSESIEQFLIAVVDELRQDVQEMDFYDFKKFLEGLGTTPSDANVVSIGGSFFFSDD